MLIQVKLCFREICQAYRMARSGVPCGCPKDVSSEKVALKALKLSGQVALEGTVGGIRQRDSLSGIRRAMPRREWGR